MPEALQRLSRCARQGAGPWLVGLACVFVLAAQALGLLHAYEHAPGPGPAPALSSPPSRVALVDPVFAHAQPHPHTHAHGEGCDHGPDPTSGQVFGHHDGSVECRLFDQLLGHADLLLAALPSLPVVQPEQHPPVFLQNPPTAASPLGYQARAPPRAGSGPLLA
jgi:hypothetical protein